MEKDEDKKDDAAPCCVTCGGRGKALTDKGRLLGTWSLIPTAVDKIT